MLAAYNYFNYHKWCICGALCLLSRWLYYLDNYNFFPIGTFVPGVFSNNIKSRRNSLFLEKNLNFPRTLRGSQLCCENLCFDPIGSPKGNPKRSTDKTSHLGYFTNQGQGLTIFTIVNRWLTDLIEALFIRPFVYIFRLEGILFRHCKSFLTRTHKVPEE